MSDRHTWEKVTQIKGNVMSNDKEVVDLLKKISDQLDVIASSQATLLQAFSLMNIANTDGDARAAWKEVKSVAVEMLKKNHEIG